jgi:hypothetical protein
MKNKKTLLNEAEVFSFMRLSGLKDLAPVFVSEQFAAMKEEEEEMDELPLDLDADEEEAELPLDLDDDEEEVDGFDPGSDDDIQALVVAIADAITDVTGTEVTAERDDEAPEGDESPEMDDMEAPEAPKMDDDELEGDDELALEGDEEELALEGGDAMSIADLMNKPVAKGGTRRARRKPRPEPKPPKGPGTVVGEEKHAEPCECGTPGCDCAEKDKREVEFGLPVMKKGPAGKKKPGRKKPRQYTTMGAGPAARTRLNLKESTKKEIAALVVEALLEKLAKQKAE